jgi:centromere protein C
MDGLFSSPAKPKGKSPQVNGFSNKTISSEEDMDVGESMYHYALLCVGCESLSGDMLICLPGTIPEVEDILDKRASFRLPPRSKSPIKTFLKSPARKNPSFDAVSSPTRGSIVVPRAASVSASVRRTLNFSNNDDSSRGSSTLKKRAGSALPSITNAKLATANHAFAPLGNDISTDMDRSEDYTEEMENTELEANIDDSLQMVDAGNDDEPEFRAEMEEDDEPEPEPEPEPQQVSMKKGKRKASEPEVSEEPMKKSRGRSKRVDVPVVEDEPERPAKRTRRSLEQAQVSAQEPSKKQKTGRTKKVAEDEPEPVAEPELAKKHMGRPRKNAEPEEVAPSKKGTDKPQKNNKTTKEAKAPSKAVVKKPKLAAMQETDSPQVKRGPPLPRSNRGLVILRRETPADGLGFKQTRSGRNSIKPLAYWKNERIEFDSADENDDGKYGKFLLPRIKEVVRADEVEQPQSKRSKSYYKSKSKKKRTVEPESEDEGIAEPWEADPGRFIGEVREWDPADAQGSFAEEVEEEIAFSNAAIVTQPVKNATFKFAKTLTLPFFGSGMVDLPPGTTKKPKNSRSMQLVFFVHFGRVKVTVHETEFRIGKGGMWQVPRG